jgi:hypothetical protein
VIQRIEVYQQHESGEEKIKGILGRGRNLRITRVVSIDCPLPRIIDEPQAYLPEEVDADLVLDFLRHPDLSHGLALMCQARGIPVVASGKKINIQGVFTPPT